MNERILKLFMQACRHADYEHQNVPRELVEKFSELIVRECIELNKQELAFNAFERMLTRYKEHFGVE